MLNSRPDTKRLAVAGVSLLSLLLSAHPSFAQVEAGKSANNEAAKSNSDRNSSDAAAQEVSGITVTGTSIRGVPPTGSNLVSVTTEDIKETGAQTTSEVLANVPLLNSFNTMPMALAFGSFAPGLRGLPSSATLTLLNGHRLVGASVQDTNPNYPDVPALALERVEIVADGSSAIYGSDAIAGVVNFITRQHYSGVELSTRYGFADNYNTFTINGLAGRDWDTGSVLVAYQHDQNTDLRAANRDYRILNFLPYGGIDTRSTSCLSPNVRIPATGATNYAAPGLVANTTNYCDNAAQADLLPAVRLDSAYLAAQQELGDKVTAWANILYSSRHQDIRAAPPTQTLTITSANPFFQAPPGSGATQETVLFRTDNLFGADHTTSRDNQKVADSSAGFDVKLPHDLKLSVYGTLDWTNDYAFVAALNPTALASAAAGTTLATALDPFGNRTSAPVMAAVTSAPTIVTINQRLYAAAAKIDGPLFDLPAGAVKFAAGAEYRRETFRQRGVVTTAPVPEDQERNSGSVYGEVFIPIANGAPLLHRLDLSISGRYDNYSDVGSTTNPKVGLDWQPVEGLTLRSAYGTSFRAPGIRQLGATVGDYYFPSTVAAVSIRDPTRDANSQVNTIELIGGNRGLRPEQATTYSFGLDWQPTFLPEFGMSVNYFNIRFTNAIQTPSAAQIFNDPTFAGRIYRNPTAAQLASLLGLGVPATIPNPLPTVGNVLDLRLGNFGIRETDGLDFNFNYRRPTAMGVAFASLAGTYYLKYSTQLSPASVAADQLQLGTARYQLRGTVGLAHGPVRVSTTVNYGSGVSNTFSMPTGTGQYQADGYTTVDLRLAWTLPDTGLTKGSELSVQVNDLFDASPPFFPGGSGAAGNFNPLGRLVAVNLQKSF